MKALKLILVFLFCIVDPASAQQLENIDKIGDFNDGLIAVSKDNSWGFIDLHGTLVIDFRKDVVAAPEQYPLFSNGLCLIKEMRENVHYYGYINTKGETVIPTVYIVATAFKNGYARVIKHYKTDTNGTNVLGKDIVSYSYNELIITTENKMALHIRGPYNLLFYKLKLQQDIPTIHSKFISPHLIAVTEDNNRFSILKVE
jgi:hypothetical protein